MGSMLRSYWQPVLLSTELPDRDGPPVRVRLLGENLIAFRDSSGTSGCSATTARTAAPRCSSGATRRTGCAASITAGSSTGTGRCMDMPNEPPESDFKDRIRHIAYPCEERGGVIWTFMGPEGTAPPLPDFEWLHVPQSHRYHHQAYAGLQLAAGARGRHGFEPCGLPPQHAQQASTWDRDRAGPGARNTSPRACNPGSR